MSNTGVGDKAVKVITRMPSTDVRMACGLAGLPVGAALFVAIALLIPHSLASAAQSRSSQDCRNDRSGDPCVETRLRHLRELYGVRSLEDHRAAGDQVRRVFYVGPSGYDLLLIAFVRPRGGNPRVSVHFPEREGERAPAPLRAALPRAVWQNVLFRSVNLDHDVASLPSRGGTSPVCMDGGTYLVEATDPARSSEEIATMRRAIDGDCDPGFARHYATELERAALPLFPYCARLASSQYPGPSLQLAACRVLRGDRMAAAEVLNAAAAFRTISGPWDAARFTGVFTERSRISWNGDRNVAPGGAAAFWAAHAAPAIGVTNIYFESIEGESAGRVRLAGTLTRTVDTPRGRATGMETARVEQIWVRDPGGAMKVESATVGPWEPYPSLRANPIEADRS